MAKTDIETGTMLTNTIEGNTLNKNPITSAVYDTVTLGAATSVTTWHRILEQSCPTWVVGSRNSEARKTSYEGNDGRAMLLVFSTGKRDDCTAILVQIDRPSTRWARKQAKKDTPKDHSQEGYTWHSRCRTRADQLEVDCYERSEERLWSAIVHAWRTCRPWYYKYTPFWRVTAIEEANVYVSEQKGDLFVAELLETPRTTDLAEQFHKSVELATKAWDVTCADCWWLCDHSGRWRRSGGLSMDCPENDPEGLECPVKVYREAKCRLDNLGKLDDFLLCFEAPRRAKWKSPLKGMAQDSCVYDQEYMTRKALLKEHFSQDDPRQSRRCLLIKTAPRWSPSTGGSIAITCLAVAAIVAWKIATGDWSVAVGFGSFVVGLVGLLFMRKSAKQTHKTKMS